MKPWRGKWDPFLSIRGVWWALFTWLFWGAGTPKCTPSPLLFFSSVITADWRMEKKRHFRLFFPLLYPYHFDRAYKNGFYITWPSIFSQTPCYTLANWMLPTPALLFSPREKMPPRLNLYFFRKLSAWREMSVLRRSSASDHPNYANPPPLPPRFTTTPRGKCARHPTTTIQQQRGIGERGRRFRV